MHAMDTTAGDPRRFDVVAIVGSAGGIAALAEVLRELPTDLQASVVVVMHLLPDHRSFLAEILGRRTDLSVKQAEEGDVLEPGTVYVAPPDVHLLVHHDGSLHLDESPPVHYVRPSADVLLASLADAKAGRCFVAVLSGTGTDGAAGAAAVKQAGGRVIAQDQATSQHFGMPGAAILTGAVDEVLALDRIAAAVVEFAGNP
jgi:two-component system, chemotaxis family, protein-glutamate methylesterase/glutaminase